MSISYKVKNNMDKVCVALEMNDFIWQTNYPESEEVCQLMRDLDYPILGCDESEIKSIDDDDFMFIEVPIQYVADYLHKDIEETVYFLENEYIADDFDGFIEFLRTRDSNFDIEKAFVNEVQNGEEEIKHILETLQEMKEKGNDLKADTYYQYYFNCLKDDVASMKQCETKQDLVNWLVDYIDNKGCGNILDVLDGKNENYSSLEDWTEEFCFNEIAEWIEEARESDEQTLTSDELWDVIEMFANEEYENGSEMLEDIKESEELKEDKEDLGEER